MALGHGVALTALIVAYAMLPTFRPALSIAIAIFSVAAVNGILHYIYFVYFPARAIQNLLTTDPNRLYAYLKRVVATPSLCGRGAKLVARHPLIWHHMEKKEYEIAIEHGKECLHAIQVVPLTDEVMGVEADVRRQLMDCYEAIGRPELATEELNRAREAIIRSRTNPVRQLNLGLLLERKSLHDEAHVVFREGFDATPPDNRLLRIQFMVHLMLSAHNAGRHRDSLSWAKEAIENEVDGAQLVIVHRVAGICCERLRDLDAAEAHYRQALSQSIAISNSPESGQIEGQLAECLRQRGKLIECERVARRLVHQGGQSARIAQALLAYVYQHWGRYDEACVEMTKFIELESLAIQHFENRMVAAWHFDMARIEVERGDSSEARGHIDKALAVLSEDKILGAIGEGILARVLASAREFADSKRTEEQLLARRAEFSHDTSCLRGVLFELGLAACTRGDFQPGLEFWEEYVRLNPQPVQLPTAYFQIGECQRALGKTALAIESYRRSVDCGLDTVQSKQAARRLGEFLPGATAGLPSSVFRGAISG
jgi:tetratricopeptide (TPR) repeat protein